MTQPASLYRETGEPLGLYPPSWYAASCDTALPCAPLAGDTAADYAIIGGGFAGLAAARALAQAGRSVALIEAGTIGWGASGRNGGQVHIGWNKEQPWFERRFGQGFAQDMWRIALDARAHLGALCDSVPDRCDLATGHLHANHRARFDADTRAHIAHMESHYGYEHLRHVAPEAMRDLVDSPFYHGGHIDLLGGHVHPLKLAMVLARQALAAGAALYPQTAATQLTPTSDGWQITTAQGRLRAGKVLMATGGYALALSREVDAHVLPLNNYIAATRPLPPDLAKRLIAGNMSVSDSRFVVYYFRMSADNRLLFGGGESYSRRFPRDIAGFVRPHLARVFPQLADVGIDYAWGGTLSITAPRLPFGREIARGLFNLSGFSGLGVVLAPYLGDAAGRAMMGEATLAWDCLTRLPAPRFPGGTWLRGPTQAAAMTFFALRDRL